MANIINRAKYYASSVSKWPFSKYFVCPNCGSHSKEIVDRKYLVTSLARCPSCEILFRRPVNTKSELTTFYSNDYTTGVTDTPRDWSPDSWGPEALRAYRDFSEYLRVMKAAGCRPGSKVFDYGCSWGYGSGQYKAAGFEVSGYEISPINRRFAREVIGINMVDDFEAYARSLQQPVYDVFISSHVLEHLPEVDPILRLSRRLVKPGGLMILFVPNGSESFMLANRPRWRRLWGEVHPLFLTDLYFRKAIKDPMLMGASPVPDEAIQGFVANPVSSTESLEGKELTCIVSVGAPD